MKSLYCFISGILIGFTFLFVIPKHVSKEHDGRTYEIRITNYTVITNVMVGSDGEYIYTVKKY